jgi:predicted TIM-barrel fold metal-dependent hydrolase
MIAMSVIDAHAHLGDFPLFGESLNLTKLLRIMDEYGIDRSVVSALPNALTLEAVRKYPERVSGLIRINPFDDDAVELIDKAVDEWGFKGVKMNPLFNNFLPDSKIVHPVMEAAGRHHVPVLIHCGHPPWSLPWSFERLADRFPDVKIVMAHMGHGHIVYINGALDVAEDFGNILVDTAGMTMHSKIREAVERLGEDRVMYGSDMPLGHPAWEIPKVKISGLNEEHIRKVLHDNAIEIYQL